MNVLRFMKMAGATMLLLSVLGGTAGAETPPDECIETRMGGEEGHIPAPVVAGTDYWGGEEGHRGDPMIIPGMGGEEGHMPKSNGIVTLKLTGWTGAGLISSEWRGYEDVLTPTVQHPSCACCENVPTAGSCTDNSLTFCDDGVVAVQDCSLEAAICAWEAEEGWYRCIAPSENIVGPMNNIPLPMALSGAAPFGGCNGAGVLPSGTLPSGLVLGASGLLWMRRRTVKA